MISYAKYEDIFKCPKCKTVTTQTRLRSSAGHMVSTDCRICRCGFKVKAGKIPANQKG